MRMVENSRALIPPPPVVRAELARAVRESRRLRSLLRLAVQTEEDRRFLESLAGRPQTPCHKAGGQGVDHGA